MVPIGFVVRRFVSSLFVLLAIAAISFVIIQLPPGDFTDVYRIRLVNQGGMTEAEATVAAQRLAAEYGLDKPVPVQFANWIRGIVTRGEFGFSVAYRRDASVIIAQRLPYTLAIALAAHAISTVIGLLLGIYAARRQYSVGDNVAAVFAFLATSVPRFSMALIIVYVLAFGLGQQSVSSLFSPEYRLAPWSFAKFLDLIKHVWPVVFIAGFGGVARNLRVMRGNLLDVLNAQYVTTARSKGLTENAVIYQHAVPNALHPIIAYQGAIFPYMLQGELEAAIVLGIPTIAPLFLDSLQNQDIYITGSLLLLYGVMLVVGNFLSDVALAALDPRIKAA